MLTQLSALDKQIEGKDFTGEHPELTLPPDVERALITLFSDIKIDVVDPFFRIDDMDSLDTNWDSWVEWFSPLMQKLVEEFFPLFADEDFRRGFVELQPRALVQVEQYIASYSDALARTFSLAVRTGFYADALLIPKIGFEFTPTEHIIDRFNKRAKHSFAFGLAFILILESIDHCEAGREKVRFLILKMKRAAANLYVHTAAILAHLEHNA